MAAQALMKRGKRSVAKYIKDECNRQSGQQQLSDLLDYLLDPEMSLDDFERMDWIKWVIAGGTTFDDFGKEGIIYNSWCCSICRLPRNLSKCDIFQFVDMTTQ